MSVTKSQTTTTKFELVKQIAIGTGNHRYKLLLYSVMALANANARSSKRNFSIERHTVMGSQVWRDRKWKRFCLDTIQVSSKLSCLKMIFKIS